MNDTLQHHPSAGPASAATGSDSLVPRLVTRWLFRHALVERNERVGPGLHRITLAGPALCGAPWAAGDKLQLKIGPGLQTRTYTPMAWDVVQGRTVLLAHALAAGPGSEWVRLARPGQAIAVFGPRRSLDLSGLDARRGVLVGDETAIGLAVAWQPAHAVLEVDAVPGIEPMLRGLGLPSTCVARRSEGRHLDALVEAMLSTGTDHDFVLVGRAHTIQVLRRALRQHGVASGRVSTKAYWADGKTGLD